jgi:acetyl esterase/lipase
MARKGFVVMAINYRLSPKHKWPAHLDDCFESLSWLSRNAKDWYGDTERVATWGYSAGAQLALLTALNPRKDLPKIRAVVAGGAPCDLTFIPENTKAIATVLGGTRAEVPERYREASPISFVSSDAPPVYFFHGDDDFLVPLSNSMKMHELLLGKGVHAIHRTIAGKGHLIAFLDQQSRLEAIEFLQRSLQK